jgi:mRNA interferase MazF
MKMNKDFKKWHNKKDNIDKIEKRPFFHEREIWFCHLGLNIGFEQDGKGGDFLRPILIIRKFNNEIFWAVPLTRTSKKSLYYFHFILNDKESVAILSQIKLIDARRLSHKIGEVREVEFGQLKDKIKALLP